MLSRAELIAIIISTTIVASLITTASLFALRSGGYRIATAANGRVVWRVNAHTGFVSLCLVPSLGDTPTCGLWGDTPFAIARNTSAQQNPPKTARTTYNDKAASGSSADIMKLLEEADARRAAKAAQRR